LFALVFTSMANSYHVAADGHLPTVAEPGCPEVEKRASLFWLMPSVRANVAVAPLVKCTVDEMSACVLKLEAWKRNT
jgi:hypothetical protein